MNDNPGRKTISVIEQAVAALGTGPLDETHIAKHIARLFSRVLERRRSSIDLANHSLGRPLDATEQDVREAIALWQTRLGDAWDQWSAEMEAYRSRLGRLLGAPRSDCVMPKTSAGQGLRAILNSYDNVPRVIATRGEFDSIDVILRQYAQRGRIELSFVEPREDGLFFEEDLLAAIDKGVDLLVVSQVVFNSGQVLPGLPALVEAAHARSGRVLLDVYHSLGVFPVDVAEATSTCEADRERAICTCIRAISIDRSPRSTSVGSPSESRFSTSARSRSSSRRAAMRFSNPRPRS